MRGAHIGVALAAALVLAGCAQPRVSVPSTGGTVPAVESSATSTSTAEPTSIPSAGSRPVGASGSVYSPAKGGPKDEERSAILAAAHLYLSEQSDFIVHQLLVQQPYAIAELQVTGTGRVFWVALVRDGADWAGLWKSPRGSTGARDLGGAAVLDAPNLVGVFDWQGTPSASEAAKILKPLVVSAGGVVDKLTVKVLIRDTDGTLWAGVVVENNIDGGVGYARRRLGKKWEVVDFGTGLEASELAGKASPAIVKAMQNAGL